MFPLRHPQWVNAVYDVRPLDKPRGAYGEPDTAFLIGHGQLREKLDVKSLTLLENLRFAVADVTEMDRLMNVEGMSALEAVRHWMDENPDAVSVWDPS